MAAIQHQPPSRTPGKGTRRLIQSANVIASSLWRRAHQAAAQKSHVKQKSQQL